jgi:hypothetical protein
MAEPVEESCGRDCRNKRCALVGAPRLAGGCIQILKQRIFGAKYPGCEISGGPKCECLRLGLQAKATRSRGQLPNKIELGDSLAAGVSTGARTAAQLCAGRTAVPAWDAAHIGPRHLAHPGVALPGLRSAIRARSMVRTPGTGGAECGRAVGDAAVAAMHASWAGRHAGRSVHGGHNGFGDFPDVRGRVPVFAVLGRTGAEICFFAVMRVGRPPARPTQPHWPSFLLS